MSEKFFEILRVLGFFFLVVTFCQFWSMSEGNEMEKSSSCSSVSDICVIEAGERLQGVVDKVDVYSWNASIISSNDSPEDSSETGVDVANGLFLRGSEELMGTVNEGGMSRDSFEVDSLCRLIEDKSATLLCCTWGRVNEGGTRSVSPKVDSL